MSIATMLGEHEDRPPTHYFNIGHRPGFWFLDPHFSSHEPPALALALELFSQTPGFGTGFGAFSTTPMLMDTR
jgi:hypothetical protein